MTNQAQNIADENEMIDMIVTVVVKPTLKGIEDTKLVNFEYKEKKIKFKTHKGNQNDETELSIQLKSKKEGLKMEIDSLMCLFLGRFELHDKGSYQHRIQCYKNLKTGSVCTRIEGYRNINIDAEYENYIQEIDNASSKNDKIMKSIIAFHYAKMAISPNHAYLSMTNAIYPLIEEIAHTNNHVSAAFITSWKLFKEKIIKDEKEKDLWDEKLKLIHDTIYKIHYENASVNIQDVEQIRELYKHFLNMYIMHKQQEET
ncbi:Uncharacterised protein [uncultured archaeon]|nr:Uncharacterised protein [uncultured archaeon]